jgi:GWxTD domain-containing protein
MKTYYKTFFVFLIILISCWINSSAQNRDRDMKLRPFDYDIAVFPNGESQQMKTNVYVWVGNYQLQFLKTDTVYTARYQVNVEIFKQKDISLLTRDTTMAINENKYSRTLSRGARHLVLFSFNLAPQDYLFRIRLLDLNSNGTVFQETTKKVPALSPAQLGVSDILIMMQEDSNNVEMTTISPMRIPIQDRVFLYVQVTLPKNVTSFDLDASLLPRDGAKPSAVNKKMSANASPANVIIKLDKSSMAEGDNDITVKITAGKQTAIAIKKVVFVSGGEAFTTGRSLPQMIEEMSYIANGDDLKKMRNAEGEEKEKLFQEFWDKRNPIPNSQENPLENEFFKRVDVANQQFSFVKTPGWKTDRGRVYIMYGAPDSIDKGSSSSGVGNYEIWYYNDLQRKFVFYDEYGFGDYRLVSGMI